MTEIEYKSSRNKLSIKCKGHANYSEYGQDIVCAGISSLCFALAYTIVDMNSADYQVFREQPKLLVESGDVEIICKPVKKSYELIKVCFDMAYRGLEKIANAYPDNVVIGPYKD